MKETMSSSSEYLTSCSNGVATGHPTHFMRHEVKHRGLNPVWPQMCSNVASGATIPQELLQLPLKRNHENACFLSTTAAVAVQHA